MRRLSLLYLALPAILFTAGSGWAATPASAKGMATVAYRGARPSPSVYRSAERAAAMNAIARYIAGKGDAESRNFGKIRSTVKADLSHYVLGSTLLVDQVDRKAKTLTIVVRSRLDTAALENAIQAHSSAGETPNVEQSYISFIFVARQQASVTRYGPDQSSLAATRHQDSGSKNGARTSDGALFSDTHTDIKRSRSSTSHTQRAALVKYRVASAGSVNTAMTGVFSDAGYRVVPAQFLEARTHDLVNPKAFEREFAKGNDISAQTLLHAVQGAEEVRIRYLAVGTLDVGLANTDPQTGLKRVFVTVTGTLYGLNGIFPQTLASVGPEQFAGLGPTETVAQTNALKLAARAAAKKMVQSMDARNVN